MKILVAHNAYLQPGGEDVVFAREVALLRSMGHDVTEFVRTNSRVRAQSLVRTAAGALWSRRVHSEMGDVLEANRPDVCHFHNTFPLISPSAYYACRNAGVPVVQTLHNYRLLCPSAFLFRKGEVCEDCQHTLTQWPAVWHGCYRGSRGASATIAAVNVGHRLAGTWWRCVDQYIALTEFARGKYLEAGLPGERIVVKPNFVYPDPGVGMHQGRYALFVGRLSPEKGILTLLQGWRLVGDRIPLKIAGTGPMAALLQAPPDGVTWLGHQSNEEVSALMKDASLLIFPTDGLETFGLTVVEAFSTGLPVVCTGRGSPAEIVRDGVTGLHYEAGNARELAGTVERLWDRPELAAEMGRAARKEFEAKYTPERNYELLMEVYRSAMERRGR